MFLVSHKTFSTIDYITNKRCFLLQNFQKTLIYQGF